LFAHRSPVTVLAVSKSFSTLLSASKDGTVILWDLNRLEFVRKLNLKATGGKGEIECARINDVTGDIMLCRGKKVLLFTHNGELILEQNVCDGERDDWIYSCAWYEGIGNEWLENSILFTGQRNGIVNVWRKAITKSSSSTSGSKDKWHLQHIKALTHNDITSNNDTAMSNLALPKTGRGRRVSEGRDAERHPEAAITCILPLAQVVYTGDEEGRVVSFPLFNFDESLKSKR
jgi:WD40 repeat protein